MTIDVIRRDEREGLLLKINTEKAYIIVIIIVICFVRCAFDLNNGGG